MRQIFTLLLFTCVSVCAATTRESAFAIPQFESVVEGIPGSRPEQSLTLRGTQVFLIQPLPDGMIALTLTYRRVNQSRPLTTTLRDSTGAVLFKEIVDNRREIRVKPKQAGTCELRVETDGGSMTLDSPCTWAVYGNMHGFSCLPTMFLYVPKATDFFSILLNGGGGEEHIALTLDAGLGVPVKHIDTSLTGSGEPLRIKVPKGGDGRVWSLSFSKPAQGFNEDFSVSIPSGVVSAFSVTADRALRGKLISVERMREVYDPGLQQLRSAFERRQDQDDVARYWRKRIEAELATIEKALLQQRRYSDQPSLQKKIDGVERFITAFAAGRLTSRQILASSVRAITNERILPTDSTLPGKLGGTVRIIAARDEFESGSFAVLPEQDFTEVEVTASALRNDAGETLPEDSLDVRVVKVWYQDEGRGYKLQTPTTSYNPIRYAGRPVLVPELLLYDEQLVRVDSESKSNALRAGVNEDGSPRYVSISDPQGLSGRTSEDFHVMDAATLQPVDLPARRVKQFWVTVRIPKNARAGIYRSQIRLSVAGRVLLSQPLEVKVLPFVLPRASTICSIYYYKPNATYYGKHVMRQYRREMENLRDHGVLDVMHPYSATNTEALQIRKEVGMSESSILFYRGWYAHGVKADTKNRLEVIRKKTSEQLSILRGYGFKDIYFYGIDEAKGKHLAAQREVWKEMRELGAKIFVAGYRNSNFKLMGDIQDLLVCAGYPVREESTQWHTAGQKILSYANPQGGCEMPETYRRNFGFLLWQYGYDGCMTYIYHWGNMQNCGSSGKSNRDFANVWNDSCRKDNYKQHNMVYPASDGVIDTLQWEGYREAIDDLRYMTVLEQRLAVAPEDSRAASLARAWLAELRQGDINADRRECEEIRAEIVKHILSLGGE